MATSKIPMIAQVSRSQFGDPGWSYDTIDANDLSKVGDVVSAKFSATRAYGEPSSQYTLATTPEGFRPSVPCIVEATVSGGGKTAKAIQVYVTTGGDVKVNSGEDVSGYTTINMCVIWN